MEKVHFKPRAETTKKYETYLKSLLVKANKEGSSFDAISFVRDAKLPSNFIKICMDLKYVRRGKIDGKKCYLPLIPHTIVDQRMGEAIAYESAKYNYKHSLTKEYTIPNEIKRGETFCLESASDDELISELRKRGYVGNLIKVI